MNLQESIRRILREEHRQIRKEDLLGKTMYHGTTLEGWEYGSMNYLFVTEDIDHAKFHADEKAHDSTKYYKEPHTAIIVKIIIDEDIIDMKWEVDDDGGRYTEYGYHTWEDSYEKIGTFVIVGNLNIDNFPIIYNKRYSSERL